MNIIGSNTGRENATVRMCMCLAINGNICLSRRSYDRAVLIVSEAKRQKTYRSRIAISVNMYVLMFLNK